MEKQELYDIVRQARQALEQTHPDAATLQNQVSQKTKADYQKCARSFFTKFANGRPTMGDKGEGSGTPSEKIRYSYYPEDADAIIKAVSSFTKSSTIRKYATAIRYVSMRKLDKLLKLIDIQQKEGSWDLAFQMASTKVMGALITLAKTLPEEYLKRAEPRAPRKSKKVSITGLPSDWREMIIARSSEKYRLAISVLALTGCRPSELAMGIQLFIRTDGIYASIRGAKVTKYAGQETRIVKLHQEKACELLGPWIEGAEEITVKFDSPNSLTTHIRNVARRLWPGKKDSVTAISFRHAMASDCKASTLLASNPEMISKILGHRVDTTRSYYGSRSQGNGRLAPQQVTATHPVKITEKSLRRLPGKSKNRSMGMKN